MSDTSWKTWAFIAILVGGGAFEIFKSLPDNNQGWKNENMRMVDPEPYSVSDTTGAPKRRHIPATRVAAEPVLQKELAKFVDANKVAATTPKPPDAGTVLRALQPGEKYEEVIDPKTGKKTVKIVKKKKKKEKKTEVAAAPTPALPDLNQIQAAVTDAQAPIMPSDNNNGLNGNGSPAVNQNANTNTNNTVSLADWERLLLTSPNKAETQLFIKDYQAGQVSATVFYTIVKAMMAQKSADFQALGALAAGSVLSSTSFTILADAEKTATGTLKTTIDTYLAEYATLAQLGTLKTVLSGSDTQAAALAAQELDNLATTTLASGNTSSAAQFSPFLTILQGLTSSSDSNLASEASTTYSYLSSAIGSTGTAVQAASALQP